MLSLLVMKEKPLLFGIFVPFIVQILHPCSDVWPLCRAISAIAGISPIIARIKALQKNVSPELSVTFIPCFCKVMASLRVGAKKDHIFAGFLSPKVMKICSKFSFLYLYHRRLYQL